MKSMMFKILLIGLVICSIYQIPALLGWYLSESGIPDYDSFPMPEAGSTILCVFAHPDDEIAAASTLASIASASGGRVVALYFTRGEAGPTGGLVPKEQLGDARTAEIKAVGSLLGFTHLELMDLGDGQLPDADTSLMHASIAKLALLYQADAIISYDDKVGLYGHKDHVAAARAALNTHLGRLHDPRWPVKKLYQITLSRNMISAAMKLSPTFKNRYPLESERGLPPADFSVKTGAFSSVKMKAIATHATQWEVFDNLMPLYKSLPESQYFRIFGREYFHEVQAGGKAQ